LAREIYDKDFLRFSESQQKDINAKKQREVVYSLLGDVNRKKILFAGCGDGFECLPAIEDGAIVTGIDISENMIKLAEQTCSGKNARFFACDMEKTDFIRGKFDIIVSICSLMYKKDLDAVLNEFRRILKEDGFVVFSVPHPIRKMIKYGQMDYFKLGKRFESCDNSLRFNYYRIFENYIDSINGMGFVLEKVVEPPPLGDGDSFSDGIYPHHAIFKIRRRARWNY